MLHGILGDGDAARAQPPRQRRDQPMGRIARQRGDEAVNRPAQPAAFALEALAGASAAVIKSIGRSSIQLVGFQRWGEPRAIASASAASLSSITKKQPPTPLASPAGAPLDTAVPPSTASGGSPPPALR